MIKRYVDLNNIIGNDRSTFLFGPRGVGKTKLSLQFLNSRPKYFSINLLKQDVITHYVLQPGLFRKEIEAKISPNEMLTVFIDEIQKYPLLLDEVHSLIEEYKGQVRFLLTGSSARKLKRGGANLLAGRAFDFKLHPLTHLETSLDLDRALRFGTLPAIYLDNKYPERALKAYVQTYLKEEIKEEALVRKIDSFIRFLDLMAQFNGEPINFSKISKPSGVSVKTTQEHVSILIDTMLAFRVNAWTYSVKLQLLQSPKIYFFDCGVLNAIRGELKTELKPNSYRYGKLFETFIIQELFRINDYKESDFKFYHWRTDKGIEVDIIMSKGPFDIPKAIEIKSGDSPQEEDLKGLLSFKKENPSAKLYCFSRSPNPYNIGEIRVLPWVQGIKELFEE